MDFFYWGGPVYCTQANNLKWERPTKVFCNPQGGIANQNYYYGLKGGTGTPLDNLLKRAKLDPATVGSIGFGGFSAFHQFLNPLLKEPEDNKRVDYVHLSDACFQGYLASKPHAGFLAFGKRAVAGAARMTVTTNGPWGQNIRYSHAGHDYHLTSGGKCFKLVWDALGVSSRGEPDVPPGIPPPDKAFRAGQLYWFHYEQGGRADSHGYHVRELAQPIMQFYGVPWMGGQRGLVALPSLSWPRVAVAGAFAAVGYFGANLLVGE
ncbi:MAG: hypothetical protein ACYTEQ_05355 [Planctomycetota bacterium]|jgi:hypothetical protein